MDVELVGVDGKPVALLFAALSVQEDSLDCAYEDCAWDFLY
jgi:hypothetical protein